MEMHQRDIGDHMNNGYKNIRYVEHLNSPIYDITGKILSFNIQNSDQEYKNITFKYYYSDDTHLIINLKNTQKMVPEEFKRYLLSKIKEAHDKNLYIKNK